ncbi:MAG: hypothetical protein ACRD22_06380, partial [Terriglobia bacterium]
MALRYKLAQTPAEWKQIKALFERWGEPMPNPDHALVAIALDSHRKVVGLQAMQVVLHASPLWITPDAGIQPIPLFHKLERGIRRIFPHFTYLFAASSKEEQAIAEKLGMIAIVRKSSLYRKDLAGFAEAQPHRSEWKHGYTDLADEND